MRRSFSAVVSLGFAVGLAACNNSQPASAPDWIGEPPNAQPTTKPTTTPTATPTSTPTATPTSTPVGQLYSGPAELAKYVQKFVDDGKMYAVDVTSDMKNPTLQIQFGDLSSYGSGVIGLCETGTNLRRVTFKTTYWNSVNETQRELLAHHELGHCVLYRPHRSDVLSSGAYASIMYPIIMSNSTYLNNTNYYLSELFAQTAQAPGTAETEVKVHICNITDL